MTTVVTDLDGTISFGGRRPTRGIRAALTRLAAAPDVRLVIATARTPRAVLPWFGPLAGRIDLLCCNGALVVPAGAGAPVAATVPAATVARIVEVLTRAGAEFCLDHGTHFEVTHPGHLPDRDREYRRVLPAGRAPTLDGVVKIVVVDGARWARVIEGLPGVGVFRHETGDLDVVAAGIDKAVALADLLGGCVSAGGGLIAFGNDRNDLGLLRRADRATVVGAGLPELDGLAHVTRVAARPAPVRLALRSALAAPRRRPTVLAPGP